MRFRLRTHTAGCRQPVAARPEGRACPHRTPWIAPCRRLRSTLGSGSCSSSLVLLPEGPQPLATVVVALALLSSCLLSRACSRARVNTGAGGGSRCDEVEDVPLWSGQGYPGAARLVEAGDLPGAGGDGQVEVDAVFGRGGLGDLAGDHAGWGGTGFE